MSDPPFVTLCISVRSIELLGTVEVITYGLYGALFNHYHWLQGLAR